jgi:Acyl-CoA carboxylase epsilon subunit
VSVDPVAPQERRALLRVVRGAPSDQEVAALTAVLAAVLAAAASAGADPVRPRALSCWADPASRLRTPLHPGAGAWRASAWPR